MLKYATPSIAVLALLGYCSIGNDSTELGRGGKKEESMNASTARLDSLNTSLTSTEATPPKRSVQ